MVKPRTSENMMVISRSSPPSTSFSGDCASCSTSAGDRYWPNAERICTPLRLLADEAGEDQRQIDRRGRQQRIGEIDQIAGAARRNTRTCRSARDANSAPTSNEA